MVDIFFALKSIIFAAYGREGVKMNFIDRIFIGELTSTVMCEECANVGALEFTSTWNRLQSYHFYFSLSHIIIIYFYL